MLFLSLSLSLSLPLNLLLCLSLLPLCLIPLSVLPVLISHKYVDDLMIGYHCNKLIEPKRMFHLGMAHNIYSGACTIKLFTAVIVAVS
jgi:hypothetical protein